MKKPITRRMAFYLRKVNAYSAARFDRIRGRPAKFPPATRPSRLLAYKTLLDAQIEIERGSA